jgi:hypothetical protein
VGCYRLSSETVLYDDKEKTCLLIDTAIPDYSNLNTKQTARVSERPGDRVQQNVESDDKNCASYNCSIRNN